MKWTGTYEGLKGYKIWKWATSSAIPGATPIAKYTKEGMFIFYYRRNCEKPDKKTFTTGIRDILHFKGKYLTVINYAAGAATIEFYCFLDHIPAEETMCQLEDYLQNGEY